MLANVFGMENQRWFEAVRSVNFSRVDQVVDEKSTNTRDRRDERTDLISAAESNNLEMVEHLLNIDHKEDEALELILKWRNSLRLGEQDRQQHLRSWRAAVDVYAENIWSGTALMDAVWQENEEIVQLLLNSGADVNAKDKWSGTSLMDAAEKGNEEIVRILLDKGADVNAKGIDVQTALMFEEENEEMPSLIDESQTALGIAMTKAANDSDKSRKGIYEDIAELLIDEGADVEAEFVKWISEDSTKKITPLIYAVEEENVKMVKKLMAKGADVNKESTNGDTALRIAERLRNEEIKNLLLKSGVRR